MFVRMKIAKRARVAGVENLVTFDANNIYEINDTDLANVFISQNWAEEVEAEEIPVNAEESDLPENWNELKAYARSLKIKVANSDSREEVVRKIEEFKAGQTVDDTGEDETESDDTETEGDTSNND